MGHNPPIGRVDARLAQPAVGHGCRQDVDRPGGDVRVIQQRSAVETRVIGRVFASLAEGTQINYNRIVSRERSDVMLKSQHMTFDELSERLRTYEQKYGYSTIQFYRRYRDGELGDDDDLMLWAGVYHLYLTSLPVRQFMQSELAAA